MDERLLQPLRIFTRQRTVFTYLPVLQECIQFALAFMLTFLRGYDPLFNRNAVFPFYTGLAEYACWG